jgi:hypothetical protein
MPLIQKSARLDSIVARSLLLADFCNNIGTQKTVSPAAGRLLRQC